MDSQLGAGDSSMVAADGAEEATNYASSRHGMKDVAVIATGGAGGAGRDMQAQVGIFVESHEMPQEVESTQPHTHRHTHTHSSTQLNTAAPCTSSEVSPRGEVHDSRTTLHGDPEVDFLSGVACTLGPARVWSWKTWSGLFPVYGKSWRCSSISWLLPESGHCQFLAP